MRTLKPLKFLFFLLFLLHAGSTYAQGEMATLMRSNGKIYVVVAVLLTIFIGLAVYLFIIDRKVTRLEKERKENSR